MEICSHKHEEIVFDCKDCPLCEAENRIYFLEGEIKALNDVINTMEADIEQYKIDIN